MTARRARALVVIATLHIDCGQATYRGRYTRQPTATYTCLLCGYHETARGPDHVRALVPHIRTTHRQVCPITAADQHTERTAA